MANKKKSYGLWKNTGSLGEGGQAWTYHVQHEDGTEGVLKLIKNPRRDWRFDREVNALKLLDSPNIPKFLDSGETDGRPWVVTANCGAPLLNFVRQAPLQERLGWCRDVALALHDAHQTGVVHRDIKPNNIVVSTDRRIARLIDFGICALADAGPPHTTIEALGNAAFAAPECFLGYPDRPASPCDIYSLGKLLYWLASGGKAIFREHTRALEGTLMAGPVSVHARILSLVRACVLENPAQRLSAFEVMERAQELLDHAVLVSNEESQGTFRLVDNLGNRNEFNSGSFRSVESVGFSRERLHPSIQMIGSPGGNVAQAEQLENTLGKPVRVKQLSLGASCFSHEARVHVFLVQDHQGTPSGHLLGEGYLAMLHCSPDIFVIDCDILVPAGTFWIVFKACDHPWSYTSLHSAVDRVAPRQVVFAESFDGGVNWEVEESPQGPGLALRIEAQMEGQPPCTSGA